MHYETILSEIHSCHMQTHADPAKISIINSPLRPKPYATLYHRTTFKPLRRKRCRGQLLDAAHGSDTELTDNKLSKAWERASEQTYTMISDQRLHPLTSHFHKPYRRPCRQREVPRQNAPKLLPFGEAESKNPIQFLSKEKANSLIWNIGSFNISHTSINTHFPKADDSDLY